MGKVRTLAWLSRRGRRPQDAVTLKGVNADWAEEAQRALTRARARSLTHTHTNTYTQAAEEPDWL